MAILPYDIPEAEREREKEDKRGQNRKKKRRGGGMREIKEGGKVCVCVRVIVCVEEEEG